MSAEPKLLPCPFCGGEAELRHGDEAAAAQCLDVKMHRLVYSGDNNAAEEVAAQWNRRPASPLSSGTIREPSEAIRAATIEECIAAILAAPQKPDPLDWGRHADEVPRSIDPSRSELVALLRSLHALSFDAPAGSADQWRDIATAPKDGTPILASMNIPAATLAARPDLDRWQGVRAVVRHTGSNITGWQMAAPVGHGGFPDSWFSGWWPLPSEHGEGR